MTVLSKLGLPDDIKVKNAKKDPRGETNDVYICRGEVGVVAGRFVLKVGKNGGERMNRESRVLRLLEGAGLPAPRILAEGCASRPYVAMEHLKGKLLWDRVDPRRACWIRQKSAHYLESYGETLARIHSSPVEADEQQRAYLYRDFHETARPLPDGTGDDILRWLSRHETGPEETVFTHGDYHTAHVLTSAGRASGVVDWEFAGMGWREFDMAWALRARKSFLNKDSERNAFLRGYTRTALYDPLKLQWCETLVYYLFAQWNQLVQPDYTRLCLSFARRSMVREKDRTALGAG